LNPDACSCATASACVRLVTSGTVEVVGPFDTLSVIFVPGAWNVSAAGLWSTTVPFGSFESTSALATAKPRASRVEFAVSNVWPTTFGTPTGCGPFETLSVTVEPSSTDAPAFGVCETTSPSGWLESTRWVLPFSFASWRSESARSTCSPTTLGTEVFGGPVDT
jgi:hypothetical protein